MFLALALAALNQDKRMLPTYDEVRALLDYDPETGALTWLRREGKKWASWNGKYAGKPAGWSDKNGYRNVLMSGKVYLGHRIGWLLVHGRWPEKVLDHINGDPSDNRISNLRECEFAENFQNVGIRKNNTTGAPGVYFDRSRETWRAEITLKGKCYKLGTFKSLEEASQAYTEAKKRLHTFQPTVRGM